jgi:glycosyltransferase involved in cell wall biosynthesis
MKIGFDAKRAFRNYTGLGNYSRTLLATLLKRFPANEYFLYTPKASENPRMESILGHPNVFTRTPTGLTRGGIWRSWGMTRDLRKDKIDVYHGLSHELPRGIRNTGIPSVVTIHDLIFLRYPEFYPATDRFIYDRKFRHGCRKADRIIAVSEQTKQDIVAYYKTDPEKISVIYQSCDPMFQEPVTTSDLDRVTKTYDLPEDYMLYVGTVNKRKNLMGIVRAMFRMKHDTPLVVIGSGDVYMQRVKEYAEEARLADRIIWLPKVPFQDFPAIYNKATVLTFPSFFEGFGIPIIESLNCLTPIIGSRGTCLEEAGGPDQLYVDPLSMGELAEAMDRAVSDREWNTLAARQGKEYVAQFNEKAIGQQIMELYESIAK